MKKGGQRNAEARRSVHVRADTCGELLDYLEKDPPVPVDLKLMDAALKTRKRRSKR